MNTLKNKQFATYNYLSRYTGVPYYYDILKNREVYGIGSNMIKNASGFSYKVKPGDTLDSLALEYYNNPSFWWVIAYYNDIMDALQPLEEETIIQIPNISSISFGATR